METLSVCVPLQALSVNKAWQGRKFKTNIYKSYEREAHILLPRMDMVMGMVEVTYEFGLKKSSYAISDVGNLEKCLSDILVQKGYIEDDRKIAVIHLRKVESPEYYVRITIEPIKTNGKTIRGNKKSNVRKLGVGV